MKNTLKIILATFYGLYLKIIRREGTRLILYYHGVLADEIIPFTQQMAYLTKKHRVVNLNELFGLKIRPNEVVIAITFDDAFENLLKYAIPVLKKYNLSAAIFVPVAKLGEDPDWDIPVGHPDKKQKIMTADQIRQLDRDGFDIHSHTLTHPRLSRCTPEEIKLELELSKLKLEEILGHRIDFISYPHGDYNSDILQSAYEVGYTKGFTIVPCNVEGLGSQGENMEIPRFRVKPTTGQREFSLICSGAMGIIGKIKIGKIS
ncbi:MAG: polysaccharide deacetylase family protein [Desulfobulbus sp.]|nr:polysaccharide deacetylase family protein [Desulfobulbus sp.]